jgi:hypothetical protein
MIGALFNVAVFAALVLCIVGFSAWAHKRVDAHQGRDFALPCRFERPVTMLSVASVTKGPGKIPPHLCLRRYGVATNSVPREKDGRVRGPRCNAFILNRYSGPPPWALASIMWRCPSQAFEFDGLAAARELW